MSATTSTFDGFTPTVRPLPTHEGDVFNSKSPSFTLSVEPNGVILTCASSLTPEPVSWLWRDWLAQGKLHILAGAPGQGKTTIALAFMATVTVGGRWPDGSRCPVGNVLMWSGEDDPADTLLPRLIAMGADTSRVFFITGARIDKEVLPFDPARDMAQLLTEAERIGDVRLIVVDPIVSMTTGDGKDNSNVRRCLQPLVYLGATLGAAVLGITHFTKGTQGRDPTERVTGSLAYGALARVVMCAAKVKGIDGDDDRRIMVRSKSNIGPDGGGFKYGITQTELDKFPGVQASLIEWGVAVDGTAHELLADAENDSGDDSPGDMETFIRGCLADGPLPAKAFRTDAEGAGFQWHTVQRAAKRMGAESRKDGMHGGWRWGFHAVPKATTLPEDNEGNNTNCVSSSSPSMLPSDESEVF